MKHLEGRGKWISVNLKESLITEPRFGTARATQRNPVKKTKKAKKQKTKNEMMKLFKGLKL